MKTTILVLMAVITASLTHSVKAENNGDMMPPPGPYKSIAELDQYRINQSVQGDSKLEENQGYSSAQSSQINRNIPEWQKQRQAQMENWVQQPGTPPAQGWNNQPAQWNNNRVAPMQNAYLGQVPNFQNNRMQQSFPFARGPVYGPGMSPMGFYNQPVQQPRY